VDLKANLEAKRSQLENKVLAQMPKNRAELVICATFISNQRSPITDIEMKAISSSEEIQKWNTGTTETNGTMDHGIKRFIIHLFVNLFR
jgi:hypothetical protein